MPTETPDLVAEHEAQQSDTPDLVQEFEQQKTAPQRPDFTQEALSGKLAQPAGAPTKLPAEQPAPTPAIPRGRGDVSQAKGGYFPPTDIPIQGVKDIKEGYEGFSGLPVPLKAMPAARGQMPRPVQPQAQVSPEDQEVLTQQENQRAASAAKMIQGAGEVGTVALPGALAAAPLSTVASIGAGVLSSKAAGKAVHGKVSPEAEDLVKATAFFIPSVLGTMAGVKAASMETPKGKFSAVEALGGKVRAGIARTPDVTSGRVKIGDTQFEVNIPRGGQPAPPPALDEATAAMVQYEQAAGNMPKPPPPVPPGQQFGNKLSGDQVDHLAQAIAKAPPDQQNSLIEEAHANMAKWINDNNGKVFIDGKVVLAKSPDQVEALSAKIINDASSAHDKNQIDLAKANDKAVTAQKKEAEKQDANTKQPPQTLYSKAINLIIESKDATTDNLSSNLKIAKKEANDLLEEIGKDHSLSAFKQDTPAPKPAAAPVKVDAQPQTEAPQSQPEAEKPTSQIAKLEEPPSAENGEIREQAKQNAIKQALEIHPGATPDQVKRIVDVTMKAFDSTVNLKKQFDDARSGSRGVDQTANDVAKQPVPDLVAQHEAAQTQTLTRHGNKGEDLSTEKPHGLYMTLDRAGVPSAHEDVGPEKFTGDATGQNVLELEPAKVKHGRFAEFESGQGSAGVLALKHLSSPEEFNGLLKMKKPELVAKLNSEFPGHDYSKYYDSYELLEALGAQRARKAGYDAMSLRDKDSAHLSSNFDEYVALKPSAVKFHEATPDLVAEHEARPERRTNLAQRKQVADMSPDERAKALLTSDTVDLPNKRAFTEADQSGKSPAVAMSDADGLKALNDKFGYDAGNALLKAKAEALKEAGPDSYHDKGDEFLHRGESPEDLKTKLSKAREILKSRVISVEQPDGKVLKFKGADFSYGTGKDLDTAEAGLKSHKSEREAAGERKRGELRGITEAGSEKGEEDHGGTAGAEHGRSGAGATGSPDGKTLADKHSNVLEFKPRPETYKTSTQGEVRGRVLEFKRKTPPPKDTGTPLHETRTAFDAATKLEAADPKAAMGIYDRLIKQGDDSETTVASWVNRGVLLYNERKFEEAAASYRRALKLDPHHSLANYNLANALEESGQKQEAVGHYEQAIKDAPSWADPYYNLARLQHQLRNNAKALEMYRAFLKREGTGQFAEIARIQIKRLTDYLTVVQGKGKPSGSGATPELKIVKETTDGREAARQRIAERAKPKQAAPAAIAQFDEAVKQTGAEVKEGKPSQEFAAKIAKADHLKPSNDAQLQKDYTGAEYQREYFTAALSEARSSWINHLPNYQEILAKSNKVNSNFKLDEINKNLNRPRDLRALQVYIKVPGDGHFLVNNTPFAIEKALKGARQGFTPAKQQESKLPNHRSPKEFDNEKYIVQLEKELADLKDRRKGELGNSGRANYIDDQIRAANENLVEAKKLNGPPHPIKGKPSERGFASMDIPEVLARGVAEPVASFIKETIKQTAEARSVDDKLFGLGKQYEADVLRAIELMKQVGPLSTPADQAAIYHHLEDNSVPLNPKQQAVLDKIVKPLMSQSSAIRSELNSAGVPMGEEGYVHRVVQGRSSQLERAMRGKQGTGKGNVLSKSAASLKQRKMFALEDEHGNRQVVAMEGGRITGFKNGAPDDMGASPRLQVGDNFNDKTGKPWTLQQATTKEIEASTNLKYYKNALASAVTDYLQLLRAKRANDALESMKADPGFNQMAFKSEKGSMPPDGWQPVNLPQFRDYYFEPHMAEVLNRFAKELHPDPVTFLEKVGNFMTASLLLNPVRHIYNIGNHWLVERGVSGVFNPLTWPTGAKAGMKAIKAVVNQNDDFLSALDHGAPMMSHRTDLQALHHELFQTIVGHLEKNPSVMSKIAEFSGYDKTGPEDTGIASTLARATGLRLLNNLRKSGQKAMWMSNDMFMLQSSYEKMAKDPGLTFEQAMKQTEKHIPNYRIPTRIMNSKAIADFMSSRLASMFGRYHYGVWKSYWEMAKETLSPESTKEERLTGINHLFMLGFLTFIAYKLFDELLRKITGNRDARMVRSGASAVPNSIKEIIQGHEDPSQLLRNTFTPAILPQAAAEAMFNRDFFSGAPVRNPKHSAGKQAIDVSKHFMDALGPVQQYNQATRNSHPTRSFLLSQVGVSTSHPKKHR